MEYPKILKRLLITPVLISRQFKNFKKLALSDLFVMIEHLEKQYIELDIRQLKMKKIFGLIQNINQFSFSYKKIRNNLYFYLVYFEWLKYCFETRLMDNGLLIWNYF